MTEQLKIPGKKVVAQETRPQILRKAVETIMIRTSSNSAINEILLLHRKCLNALIFTAKKQREDEPGLDRFSTSISTIELLAGQKAAKNREYIKSVIKSLPDLKVDIDYGGRNGLWGVSALIAEVYVNESTGLITYTIPTILSELILNPKIYSKLDISIQNKFSSSAALALYEVCNRYNGSEFGETKREHWTWWSTILTGSNKPHDTFRDFNKVLSRAIEQVNAVSQTFEINLQIEKEGRAYSRMWFQLTNKARLSIEDEIEKNLTELGITSTQAGALTKQHSAQYLYAQIEYTRKRIRNKKLAKLENPAGFLMEAIQENYGQYKVEDDENKNSSKGNNENNEKLGPRERTNYLKVWTRFQRDKILKEFSDLPIDIQNAKIDEIKDELANNESIWNVYLTKGITKLVVTAIVDVYFKRLPTPTDDELIRFYDVM